MADGLIRWGILGTGGIAHQFADGLRHLDDAQLLAVGSRSQDTAERFGNEFDVPRAYGTYEQLVGDSEVDVVYIATPHNLHRSNTLLALEAGKSVLCEKPFAINAGELREVLAIARRQKLFLMEAMWTRFFPAMQKVRDLIDEGAVGKLQMLTADFGFREPFDATSHLYDMNFGGGALLDVGVYGVSLASMLFGKPARSTSLAQLGKSGVDEQSGCLFGYDDGQLAILYAAISTETPQQATIMGTEGMIKMESPWWCPAKLTLVRDETPQLIDVPYLGNGYCYEAMEVNRCLRAGLSESELMPLDESLQIMETMGRPPPRLGTTISYGLNETWCTER